MKERIYYEINEQSARTAHEMMSMQEYKEGSKTREYRNLVDNAYDLAGQVEEKRPLQSERAYKKDIQEKWLSISIKIVQ